MTTKVKTLIRLGIIKKKQLICSLLVFMILFSSINYGHAISINSSSAILIEAKTGKILYQKNADIQRQMASTSKIMTYLLTMEAIDDGKIKMEDILTVSINAANAGGASFNLRANDRLTVKELIESMMIISANDSAVVLAEYIEGSVANFSVKMNEKSKSLGLDSAYFINPNGMPLEDDDQNKISAKDLAYLSKHVIDKYGDQVIKITSQKQFNGVHKKFSQKSTNKLLETTSFIDGFKTGYTGLAGYCLVSTNKVENANKNRLISVVLGGRSQNDRFNDSKNIIEYGLNNFYTQTVVEKGELLGYSQIISDEYIPIEFIAKDNASVLSLKNIDSSKDREFIFNNDEINKDTLSKGEMKSILKLKDGTEMEIIMIAKRGISVFIDENPIIFEDAIPFIKDGATLMPLRKIIESLGAELEWDGPTKTIIVKKDEMLIRLTIDSNLASVDGKSVNLTVAPSIVKECTMVPVKFIAESLGMEIQWDSENRAVKIFNNNEDNEIKEDNAA